MGKIRTLFITLGLLFSIFQLAAQTNSSENDGLLIVDKDYSFSANTGGYKAIGINPANIGFYSRPDGHASLSVFAFTGSFYSEIWKRTRFHNQTLAFLNSETGQPVDKNNLRLLDLLRDDVKANAEMEYFAFSISTKVAGTFAFNAKTTVLAGMRLNDFTKGLVFSDDVQAYLIDSLVNKLYTEINSGSGLTTSGVLNMLNGTRLKLSAFHEINLNYSNRIVKTENLKLFGGIGTKFIITQFDFASSVNNGEVAGYLTNMSFLPSTAQADIVNLASDITGKKVGTGIGFDFGLTLEVKEKLRFSLGVVDIGSIRWPITRFTLNDSISSAELFNNFVAANNLENGIFYYRTEDENKEILPAKLNFGVNYKLNKFVNFYLDVIKPLNNSQRNIDKTIVGFGTLLSAFGWVELRTGLTFNDTRSPETVTMPFYISAILGKTTAFELGIGTADFISVLSPSRPSLSLNTALIRFQF